MTKPTKTLKVLKAKKAPAGVEDLIIKRVKFDEGLAKANAIVQRQVVKSAEFIYGVKGQDLADELIRKDSMRLREQVLANTESESVDTTNLQIIDLIAFMAHLGFYPKDGKAGSRGFADSTRVRQDLSFVDAQLLYNSILDIDDYIQVIGEDTLLSEWKTFQIGRGTSRQDIVVANVNQMAEAINNKLFERLKLSKSGGKLFANDVRVALSAGISAE
ncbi:hypothetical protein [Pseudoalteromonas phage J2-1_QLiu-2017]|nr:hypothetical protein [Pseudoalteromonas phage J2-1_QLiu-2017]